MVARIGIRDLRNRTSEAIRLAARDGSVIITEHGRPVAVLRPYVEAWRLEAARLLDDDAGTATDTGLAGLLATDDETSTDDL